MSHKFNQMIETFCEILVLYRELFVEKASSDSQEQPKETILKSLLNSNQTSHKPDLEKMEIVCKKLIARLFYLETLEQKYSLKSDLKKRIKKLSQFITFFFDEMRVFHGELTNYQKGGEGHLLDLENNFEYFGRVKGGILAGRGRKWVSSDFSVEGYFDQGKLCGFGQKVYSDGSLYR